MKKIFKAYFVHLNNDIATYSHSLSSIPKKGDFYNEFEETQKTFIDQLEPLNIETRYPLHKERLLKSLDEEKCREILNNTRKLQGWIKLKL